MTSAESAQLRRDIYEAWVTRGSELGPERRALRQQCRSSPRYCRCVTSSRSCSASRTTPTTLWPPAWRRAASRSSRFWTTWRAGAGRPRVRNFRTSKSLRAASSNAWDLAFFGERLQESRFKVSQEALRPYFPLPKVLSGLFALTQRLYGITVRERPGVSVWHPSVKYYDLVDARGTRRRGLLSRSVFAHREAQRRVDGRMRDCQIPAFGQGSARRAAGMQFHRAGRRGGLAC